MSARGQEMERLDTAWRRAAAITYRDYLIDQYNDGSPETDRALSAGERQRQQAAIAFIAEQTGISTGFIKGELWKAAHAYAWAPGSDNDPDYRVPPHWEALADSWRAVLWQRLDNAPSQVQQEFWAGQDPQGNPTSPSRRSRRPTRQQPTD